MTGRAYPFIGRCWLPGLRTLTFGISQSVPDLLHRQKDLCFLWYGSHIVCPCVVVLLVWGLQIAFLTKKLSFLKFLPAALDLPSQAKLTLLKLPAIFLGAIERSTSIHAADDPADATHLAKQLLACYLNEDDLEFSGKLASYSISIQCNILSSQ